MVDYKKINEIIKKEVEKEAAIADEMAYKRGYAKAKAEDGDRKDKEDEDRMEDYAEGYVDGLEHMIDALFEILEMEYPERREKFGTVHIMDILENNHPLDILKVLIGPTTEDEVDKVVRAIKESDLEESLKESLADYIKVNKLVVFKL